MNLNDNNPLLDLSTRAKGTEPESLFPAKFLQFQLNGIMSLLMVAELQDKGRITYKVLKFGSSDRNSGTRPVKLFSDKSLKN